MPTVVSSIATIAAYTYADEWRRAMLKYTEENILFAERYLARHLSRIRVARPQKPLFGYGWIAESLVWTIVSL